MIETKHFAHISIITSDMKHYDEANIGISLISLTQYPLSRKQSRLVIAWTFLFEPSVISVRVGYFEGKMYLLMMFISLWWR